MGRDEEGREHWRRRRVRECGGGGVRVEGGRGGEGEEENPNLSRAAPGTSSPCAGR